MSAVKDDSSLTGVETKTHDYTRRTWGHDFCTIGAIDDARLKLAGWGCGIKNGDYLILPNGSTTTRYCVDNIKYESNPADMWFADVTFAPRRS